MSEQFRVALPDHIPVEKFVRVVVTAVQNTPALLDADRKSLYGAAMKCAQDGLLPDGREAALVIFGKAVQYMPMVGGILKKVRNSNELLSIAAHVVYDKDDFSYCLGDDEKIEHMPYLEGERGKPRLTYAIAKTKDGGIYREIITESQMTAIRNVSRAKDSGPWAGPFADEMRRKSAIRRLSKRLPMSTDAERTLKADDELFEPGAPEPAAVDIGGGSTTDAGEQQQAQPAQQRKPKALAAIAENAGTPAPAATVKTDREPAVIEGEARQEPAQQQAGQPAPVDVI